jgi:type VI secretion system protein ImpA
MTSLDELLAPLSADDPAGPDLAHDEQRRQIDEAFEASARIEPGKSDPTDWRQVINLILEQGGRTRDVWLPVYLARAGARAGRLETVELGCEYLAGLFEKHWDTMHPKLEELDFQGRNGPCESLVRIGEFLGPLRRMPFVAHPRLGSFSGEDLERFARDGEAADNYGPFRAAVAEAPPEELRATVERLDRIGAALRRVDEILTAKADGSAGTNFAPTFAALESIRLGLAPYVHCEEASGPEGDEGAATRTPASGAEAARRTDGRIETRDDVLRALEAVIDYYRRREPTSPVPVAIDRAKGWVNMDFLTVLADIVPESLGDARRVLSSARPED